MENTNENINENINEVPINEVPVIELPQPPKRTYVKHPGATTVHELKNKKGYIQKREYIKKKYISPEMIEEMKNMLAQNIKRKDICAKFHISMPTLKKYTY